MVDLLSSPENQQLVTGYRSRIFAMDPYAEHSSGSNINSQELPDDEVMVDYLDTQSDPTLLNTVNTQELSEASLFQEKEPIKNKQQSDLAGFEKGSDELSNFDTNLDQIKPNAKADIPDWIKELAPEKSENGNVPEELEQTHEQPQERKDDPAEIEQPATGSPAEELIAGSLEGIPSWLRDMGTDELFKPDEIDESLEGTDLDIGGDSTSIESEIPEWLVGEQNDSVSSDIPIKKPISEMDGYELPDWLKGIESEKDIDNLKSVDGFDPSILVGNNDVTNNNIPVEEFEPDISTITSIPDIETELISSPEAVINEDIDKTKGEVQDHDVVEKDREIISEDGSTTIQEPDEAVVGSVEITEGSSTSPVPEPMEQISDLNDADAAFAWLESLAARQGANPDELTSKPDDRDLEPPDWIKNAMEGESVNQIEGSVEPEELIAHSYEEELSTLKESEESAVSDVEKPQQQEFSEKETSEDIVSEQNKEGILQKEDLNNLEESSELVRELLQEADTESETNAWIPAKDSIADGEEIKTAGEMEEEFLPSGSAADDLPIETEIEKAVEAEQPLGAGDWHPFEENDLDIGSDLLQDPQSDLIASNEEKSQLSKVPAGGSLTKIPGKDVEKEADILETAQSFLSRRDLKNALEEYRKLIKKGKLLEGVIYDLKEISYQYPIDVSVWQSLGDAYMRANQLQDALESYTKAEELLR